jgi:cytochrome P450
VDRYAFVPFSAGARRCIGEYFSFVEMQMHLALLAPCFALRFEPASATAPGNGIELDPAVNLRTRHNIHLKIQHRKAA